MTVKSETWCDRDEHKLFEHFVDFNEWLESEDGAEVREETRVGVRSITLLHFYFVYTVSLGTDLLKRI